MELTKEQIQSINNILEEKGVKFWDVRLEMVDHIANDIEDNLINNKDFSEALELSQQKLGLSGNLESLIVQKQKEINKRLSRTHWKILKSFFRNPLYLLIYCSLLFALYYLNNYFILKIVMISLYGLLGVKILFSLINYTRVFKSIQLLNTVNLTTFTISILNLFVLIPKQFFGINYSREVWSLLILIAISIPLIYTSLKIFIDTYSKYNFTTLKL